MHTDNREQSNDQLSSRLRAAATSLEDAAHHYEQQRKHVRPAGSVDRRATRAGLVGGLAAASIALIVGVAGVNGAFSARTPQELDVAAGEAADTGPVWTTAVPPTIVGSAMTTSTWEVDSVPVLDLGWPSTPTEIVFASGSTAVQLRAWWENTSPGSQTTRETGSAHGSGVFRATAGQKLSMSGSVAATVTISTLDTTTNDPVVAVFTLPGRGTAVLPVTGRYSILVDTVISEPSAMSFSIR